MNLTFTAEVELYHLSKVVFSSLLHCKLFGVFFLFKLEVSFEKTIWGDVNISVSCQILRVCLNPEDFIDLDNYSSVVT